MRQESPPVLVAATRTALRPIIVALTISLVAPAAAAGTHGSDSAYTAPSRLVDIGGGRWLNLVCMGAGRPTVLFEAGLSDWSSKWVRVQPAVARTTRACAYDRAGMGFSDGQPSRPYSANDLVDDLHALIRSAPLQRPLVLVGHSLGGGLALLYAQRYRRDVTGLVLLDPYNGYFASRMTAVSRTYATTNRSELAPYEACVRAAARRSLTPSSPLLRGCTDSVSSMRNMGSALIASRHRIEATAAYQNAQLNDLREADASDVRQFNANARRLGALPLIVITTGTHFPSYGIGAKRAYRIWYESHQQISMLSSRGRHVSYPHEPHNMQLTRPSAVIDAVTAVVRAARGGAL